jgi:transcriptional antiterminator RfaH
MNDQLNDKQWFVVRTNPRSEKKVAERFVKAKIVHYLPLYKTIKQWHDRKKRVEEPLIKGYIFVYLTDKERSTIFGISGVVRYLFVHGQIAIINEKDIANLKLFCKFESIEIEKNNHDVGSEIEVISGQLIGLRGFIKETAKGNFILIEISDLGFFASIKINKSEIRMISKNIGNGNV